MFPCSIIRIPWLSHSREGLPIHPKQGFPVHPRPGKLKIWHQTLYIIHNPTSMICFPRSALFNIPKGAFPYLLLLPGSYNLVGHYFLHTPTPRSEFIIEFRKNPLKSSIVNRKSTIVPQHTHGTDALLRAIKNRKCIYLFKFINISPFSYKAEGDGLACPFT